MIKLDVDADRTAAYQPKKGGEKKGQEEEEPNVFYQLELCKL